MRRPTAGVHPMSPSRIFILGRWRRRCSWRRSGRDRRVRFLPLGAPRGRLPDDRSQTFLPGASPDVMTSSVTAPLERQLGQMPGLNADVVLELGGRLGDHAPVHARPEPRHRRAGGPGRDQRGRQPPARGPARAPDLRQDQPRRRPGAVARAHLEDAAPDHGRGPRGHPASRRTSPSSPAWGS